MKRLLMLMAIMLTLVMPALGQLPQADRYAVADYIPAGFAVAVNSSGYAVIADSVTNTGFVGIAYNSAQSPDEVQVVTTGSYTNTRWSFTAGRDVYLGSSGRLQTRVAIGAPIGYAATSTTVVLKTRPQVTAGLVDYEAVATFIEEFDADSIALLNRGWLMTNDSVLVSYRDSLGGVASMKTIAGAPNRITMQRKVESFKLVSGLPMLYKQRICVDSSMVNTKILVGLIVRETAPADSLRDAGVLQGAYFYKAGGDSIFSYRATKDTSSASTYETAATTSYKIPVLFGKVAWVTLAIDWDGSSLRFIVNGSVVGTVTSANYLPTTEMTPTVAFNNSASGTRTLLLDYIYGRHWRVTP